MILDLSKATKRKCLKMHFQTPCWRQQMFGKGSLGRCCSQSLMRHLAASASPGQLVRNRLLALPHTSGSISLSERVPVIQTGLESFHWRPNDPSCQSLAKVPTGHLSLPQESTYVGLLLSTITIGSYFYVVCCAYFFLTEKQLYSSQVHLKDSHLYYY